MISEYPTFRDISRPKDHLVPWEGYQETAPAEDEHKEWLKSGQVQRRYYDFMWTCML